MPPFNIKGLSIDGNVNVAPGLSYNFTGNGGKLIMVEPPGWSNQFIHSFTIEFPSIIDANSYFNTGGEIRFSSVLEDPTTPPAFDYQAMLEKLGTVIFSNTMTNSFGIGFGSQIGFQDVANAFINDPITIFEISDGAFDSGLDYGDIFFNIRVLKRSDITYEFQIIYKYQSAVIEDIGGFIITYIDEKRYTELSPPVYTEII